MKIINGKDYYDTASYGFDPSIVFIRNARLNPKNLGDIPEDGWKSDLVPPSLPPTSIYRYIKIKNNWLEPACIYFYMFVAGKIYPGIIFFAPTKTRFTPKIKKIIYDYNIAKKEFKKWFLKKDEAILHDHFNYRISDPNLKWFIENNIITAYIDGGGSEFNRNITVYVNGDFLHEFEFYKVLDPFTCNMEIANYIGGVLPSSANPMVELNDKQRIQKHGFDTIKSFRNMPRD